MEKTKNIAKNRSLKRLLFFVLALLCFNCFSQVNLVPNPSFEDSISIPLTHSEIAKCKNWYSIAGSPDYYSVYSPTFVPGPGASVNIPKNCWGNQKARTKNFYVGIYLSLLPSGTVPFFSKNRECIAVKLTQPLVANHSYSFTMYYSLSESSTMGTSQLTAYFSVNQFTLGGNFFDSTIYYNYLQTQINHNSSFITDTANWMPLTGCFVAQGGEDYLSIGDFKSAAYTPTINVATSFTPCSGTGGVGQKFSYIYIDDVSLYDIGFYSGAAQCRNDTLLCSGNSFVIGNNLKDSSQYFWSPSAGLSCTNCPNPIASPSVTTKYVLTKVQCSATTKDSVLIIVKSPTITANAGKDSTICSGDKISIGTSDSLSFTSYIWQPGTGLSCTNCATPMANPNSTTTYTLQRTECAFVTSDAVTITIDDCEPTYTVPNVFTPNYDGKNDTWGINFSNSKYISNFKMSIYDRWGLLVYSTNYELSTPNSRWDGHTYSGEACTNGVYFYIITFDKNGESVKLNGRLSLIK